MISIAFASTSAHAAPLEPLTVDDVIALAELSGRPPEVLDRVRVELIRDACIAFPTTTANIDRLVSAGVDDVIIEAIFEACFRGAELVVESIPDGVEVFLKERSVGKTPFAIRYEVGGALEVAVKASAGEWREKVKLERGKRTHAFVGFEQPPVDVPALISPAEVARELELEAQWTPLENAPPDPEKPKGYFGSAPANILAVAGGLAGGIGCVAYTWPVSDLDGGEDVLNFVVGTGGGLLAAMIVNGTIGLIVDPARKRKYEEDVVALKAWEAKNATAREAWIDRHPMLRHVIEENARARTAAMLENEQIEASNRQIPKTSVTMSSLADEGTP